jgi:hypothetical protein
MTKREPKPRPLRVVGNLAYVPLTKGYEAVIDADDARLVEPWRWSAKVTKWTVYAERSYRDNGTRFTVKMHRSILGAEAGALVDHRDGNGLNNRRGNLRFATRAENARNRRIGKDNTSGFKGVTFYKPYGTWRAQICVDNHKMHLGYFDTPEGAYAEYCAASERLHGNFSKVS